MFLSTIAVVVSTIRVVEHEVDDQLLAQKDVGDMILAGIGTLVKGVGKMALKGAQTVAGNAIGNVLNYGGTLSKKADKAAKNARKHARLASDELLWDGGRGIIHEGAPMCDPLIFAQSDMTDDALF